MAWPKKKKTKDWVGCVVAQHTEGPDRARLGQTGKNQVISVMGRSLWAEILGPMACLEGEVWREAAGGRGRGDLWWVGGAVSLTGERWGEALVADTVSGLGVALFFHFLKDLFID